MDSNKKNWKNNVKKFQQNCSCVKVDCMRNLGSVKHILIDPPVEFQDNPIESFVEKFAGKFISKLISEAFMVSCKITWSIPCCKNCLLLNSVSLNSSDFFNRLQLLWSPELLAFKKSFSSVPACISVSQNSLSILSSTSTDHSEDNVTSKHITDMYNVPFDSDLYAVPVDVIHENFSRLSNQISSSIKRDKYYHSFDCVSEYYPFTAVSSKDKCNKSSRLCSTNSSTVKRPLCSSQTSSVEPVHVTVEEVRHYLNTFYSNQHEISENKNLNDHIKRLRNPFKIHQSNNEDNKLNLVVRNNYIPTIKNKKIKDNSKISNRSISKLETNPKLKKRSTSKSSFSTNVKETLCNMFRLKKLSSGGEDLRKKDISTDHEDFNSCVEHSQSRPLKSSKSRPPFLKRALPPVPGEDLKNPVNKIIPDSSVEETIQHSHYKPSQAMAPVDFASSIEKVKDVSLQLLINPLKMSALLVAETTQVRNNIIHTPTPLRTYWPLSSVLLLVTLRVVRSTPILYLFDFK